MRARMYMAFCIVEPKDERGNGGHYNGVYLFEEASSEKIARERIEEKLRLDYLSGYIYHIERRG